MSDSFKTGCGPLQGSPLAKAEPEPLRAGRYRRDHRKQLHWRHIYHGNGTGEAALALSPSGKMIEGYSVLYHNDGFTCEGWVVSYSRYATGPDGEPTATDIYIEFPDIANMRVGKATCQAHYEEMQKAAAESPFRIAFIIQI